MRGDFLIFHDPALGMRTWCSAAEGGDFVDEPLHQHVAKAMGRCRDRPPSTRLRSR